MSYLSSEQAESLIAAAREARSRAYAPYSGFRVGAAILAEDGTVVGGCNVENASYGLTICAERVALFKARSEGLTQFVALAVVADTDRLTPPCGACRQVIWELAGDVEIYLANLSTGRAKYRMRSLLPEPFGPDYLQENPPAASS